MEVRSGLCLRDLPLFADVGPDVFRPVCAIADKRSLRRGDVLFAQGDPVHAVHLIKQGSFKLVRLTEDGREVVLRLASQGEILGEDALFQNSIYAASAVALDEAKVCSISRQRLEDVIKQRPDLAWQVIASLGSRLYDLWAQVTELSGQSIREKVLSLLVRLASEHGEKAPEGTRIRLRLTQEDIAGLVGASRVRVALVLRELHEEDRISRRGHNYVLRDDCSLKS